MSAARPHSPLESTSPRARALADQTVLLLSMLAEESGVSFGRASEVQALAPDRDDQPVEWIARASRTAGLRTVHRRMSLADAVWLADSRLPVVGWSDARQCWIALRRHGLFSARAWFGDEPQRGERVASRAELARALGLEGHASVGEFAMLVPELVEAGAHDHHGHGEGMPPVRRLLTLMRPESSELWAIVIFSAITGLLYLALPLAINAFISNLSFGVRSGPFVQALGAIALVLFACLAVGASLRAIQHVMAEVIQRRIFVRLASDLAHRLPRVDLAALDGVHAPELVNRFLEVVTVQKSAALLLLSGINLALGAAIGLTVLAFYHPFLLGFSAVLLGVVAAIVLLAGRGAVDTSIRESIRKYEVVDWLEELARHPRLFKGPGGAAHASARADDLLRGYLQARKDHFRVLLRQVVGLLGLEVIAGTMLLGVGGWLVLNQQLTLGQLVAAEIIVSAIAASISKFGKQFEAWYDAVAAVDKLGMLVDLPLERRGGESVEGASAMRVEAAGLGLERPGQGSAFSGVTFELEPGSRAALLGSFGSGSSTLLEVLVGMRRPTDGGVTIDGLDLANWNLERLRDSAMLLREGDLVSGPLLENLRVGRSDLPLVQVQRAIEAVGLDRAIQALPDGLSSRLVTGGLPLAGRQRIRLLVARAVACEPRLLLVDELLDGLDERTLSSLCAVLLDPARAWTLLVATRDPRVAARFSRVIDLDAFRPGAPHG